MERLRVNLNVSKVTETGQVLVKNILDSVRDYDRLEGQDGMTIRCKNTDGVKTVPMADFSAVNLLIIEGVWAETNTGFATVADAPAPVLISVNGAIAVPMSRMTLEEPSGITSLTVQAGDAVNDQVVKVRVIVSSK